MNQNEFSNILYSNLKELFVCMSWGIDTDNITFDNTVDKLSICFLSILRETDATCQW